MLVSATGSLEGHMLQKVCCPVRFVGLCARASVYPDTDGRGLCMRMRLCCNCETIWKRGRLGNGGRDVGSSRKRPHGPLARRVRLCREG